MGGHSYEDFRPSYLFPTRSGLLGLVGACLGLERGDREGLARLAEGLEFTVRADRLGVCAARPDLPEKQALKLPDFHTVLDARKVDGSTSRNPVVSRREYLFDAVFTVAVGARDGSAVSLESVAAAVQKPRYTPSLGRRSCPLARPPFESWVEADDGKAALRQIAPSCGMIYAEGEALANTRPMQIRDVPLHGRHRQFGTRWIYVHTDDGEG
jgi:CRISPR system Cascade subunit CasD